MHRTYKDNDVMAKHLTERLVDLCAARLASQPVSELRLYHVEGRLDIASLVIALHKLLLIVRKVMVHLTPERGLFGARAARRGVRLEGYVGHGVSVNDRLHIIRAAIRLICA